MINVKISCTVTEFGKLVRGCESVGTCNYCALYQVCNSEDGGRIEQFIRAYLITDDVEEGNE